MILKSRFLKKRRGGGSGKYFFHHKVLKNKSKLNFCDGTKKRRGGGSGKIEKFGQNVNCDGNHHKSGKISKPKRKRLMVYHHRRIRFGFDNVGAH